MGIRGDASRGLILALLALAVAPAVAHAATRQLDRKEVIAIAGASPQVAAVIRDQPRAHWEVLYSRPTHIWTAVLEAPGKHTVLATVRVADRSSSIETSLSFQRIVVSRMVARSPITSMPNV